jgi:hypothetical protein
MSTLRLPDALHSTLCAVVPTVALESSAAFGMTDVDPSFEAHDTRTSSLKVFLLRGMQPLQAHHLQDVCRVLDTLSTWTMDQVRSKLVPAVHGFEARVAVFNMGPTHSVISTYIEDVAVHPTLVVLVDEYGQDMNALGGPCGGLVSCLFYALCTLCPTAQPSPFACPKSTPGNNPNPRRTQGCPTRHFVTQRKYGR